MRRLLWVGFVPLLAVFRKIRLSGAVSGIVVLPVLGTLVLGGLYQSLGGKGMDLAVFSQWWPYFIGSAAFIAGAAWDLELLSGIFGFYRFSMVKTLWSRFFYGAVNIFPVFMLFFGLRLAYFPQKFFLELPLMVLAAISWSILGTGVALCFGFGNDKGINNIAQVTPWIFALGAGPFFDAGVPIVRFLFAPAAGFLLPWVEIIRGIAIIFLGLALAYTAVGARRHPIYGN